ncbi:MAG: Gfo/Idh/MocA family oxidoreductase, partial [Gammaproteobacteria bacterium]|nr:Gfo/Idh/MocA family oxidoreductase [Gammaproteobacteria bacterium]
MNSNVVRVAAIGAGYWGKNLVRNFAEIGALGWVCDANREVCESLATAHGAIAEPGFDAILSNPEVKAVSIATPAATHGRLVRAALEAGKDVLVEKPLCLDEQEGRALVELARARGRVLMVGHLLWYHPAVLELKRLIAAGELGRVRYIYSNRLNLGKLRREENVLWSFAPHDVSVMLGLLGEQPRSVLGRGGRFLHENLFDTTMTTLDFASGVQGHIFVSWLHPFKEQKLVVVGERKMVVFDDTAPWAEKLAIYNHRVDWPAGIPVAHKAAAEYVALEQREPLRAECEHFLHCVRTRETPRTDGAEGLRVLSVLNACQAALEGGHAVRLDAPTKADFFLHPSAVVDERVEIGARTRIWHFSHVLSNTRVGEDCVIGQNCVLGPDVSIGRGCRIQNNVSVYKGVTLEDDVFCGPSMVFTNVMNPRANVSRKDEFRDTRVRTGASIGANATIVCGVTL